MAFGATGYKLSARGELYVLLAGGLLVNGGKSWGESSKHTLFVVVGDFLYPSKCS